MDGHIVMRLQEGYLPVHIFHPVLKSRGEVRRREVTLGAVAQYLGQAVITRHDHKTAVGTAVKHEETPLRSRIGQAYHGLSVTGGQTGSSRREEIVGHLTGCRHTDRGGMHGACHRHGDSKKGKKHTLHNI